MLLSVVRENFNEWMMSVHTPAPFILMQGEGSCLWDQQGKGYTDFTGGIVANALGHAHSALHEVSNDQVSKFWYTGSDYTNRPALHLVKKLIGATSAERTFFCNSGAEANGAVLKLARKYAHDCSGSRESRTVAFKDAFHGYTLFIVSAGGQSAYSQDFAPLSLDIRHAVYDDPDSASQLIDDIVCAVIVEFVRGEGGVVPAMKAFLQGLRKLCDRHNMLLIFNEVQISAGRIGELYAYTHYDVTSDLLTTAKALGGGFPIGAPLVTECCVSMMAVGTHGTIYGGNPLATAVADELLEIVNTPGVPNGVKQRHDWFMERINTINEHFGLSSETCGLGLLIGCVLNAELAGKAKLISQEAAVAGVMVLIAGANVVRSAPALNVNEEEAVIRLNRSALAYERIKVGGSL